MYNFWLGEETNIASEVQDTESNSFEKTYKSVAKAFNMHELLLFYKEFNGESDIIKKAIKYRDLFLNERDLFLNERESIEIGFDIIDNYPIDTLEAIENDFGNTYFFRIANILAECLYSTNVRKIIESFKR